MIRVLLYTPAQQRDALGHAIVRIEHGTWSHVAVERQGVVIEAVWPRVHVLHGPDAAFALAGAGATATLQPHDAWSEERAWQRALSWIGKPYSLAEIVGDMLASTLAIRDVIPQLPGAVNCSHLAADVAQVAGDTRVPINRLPVGVTPADLGGWLLGLRVPMPH